MQSQGLSTVKDSRLS